MKKVFSSIKELIPSVRRIWNGYGYYISLAVLLAVFGTIAWMYRTGKTSSDDFYAKENADEYRPAMAYATAAPVSTPEPEVALLMPVNGEIIGEYSPDELIWNSSLGQWRSHPAVDIAAPEGCAVATCADGVITAAYEDAVLGNLVEITHEDGSISRVSPLLSLEMAEIGAHVRRGEIIGSVGPASILESDMISHIHFELEKDSASIEPVFEP